MTDDDSPKLNLGHYHEIMDRASLVRNVFHREIEETLAVQNHEELRARADEVGDVLLEFYQSAANVYWGMEEKSVGDEAEKGSVVGGSKPGSPKDPQAETPVEAVRDPSLVTDTVRRAAAGCPRCNSPAPHLHPAVQAGGEVSPCSDSFHERLTPENTAKRVAEHKAMLRKFAEPAGAVLDEVLRRFEESSADEAVAVLFKALGWTSGGINSAAIEIVRQRNAERDRAERAESERDEFEERIRGAVAISTLAVHARESMRGLVIQSLDLCTEVERQRDKATELRATAVTECRALVVGVKRLTAQMRVILAVVGEPPDDGDVAEWIVKRWAEVATERDAALRRVKAWEPVMALLGHKLPAVLPPDISSLLANVPEEHRVRYRLPEPESSK